MDKKIYQVDDNGEIVGTWDDVKQICTNLDPDQTIQRPGFDNALRKKIKCRGYFWIWKHEWENGIRPDHSKQIRNIPVYAYSPEDKEELRRSEYRDYKVDFDKMEFLGKFDNAVECANKLKISVSNIREVLKGNKILHKGYYFSFAPLKIEHAD